MLLHFDRVAERSQVHEVTFDRSARRSVALRKLRHAVGAQTQTLGEVIKARCLAPRSRHVS
mgnify:CR=1 FL=1